MIGYSPSRVPRSTPRCCERRRRRSWPRWGYTCRRKRPASPISTRVSTFWGGASSVIASGKRGTTRCYVYTYPAKKALRAVMAKVKTVCRNMDTNQPLDILLIQLNQILQGWCVHFRPGVSSKTFGYLAHYTWWQVVKWLQRKHRRIGWRRLRRRYFSHGWWPTTSSRRLFNPSEMRTTRYRYRGTAIASPWPRAG